MVFQLLKLSQILIGLSNNMKLDIVINTDDNYIQHSMAMLCSLYENNKIHNITLHILSNKLTSKNKNHIIEITERYNNEYLFYQVDETILEGVQFRNKRPLTKAAYYRLMLTSLLNSKINKVLYLDCDLIILQDISELFNLEIDNYALAACLDKFPYSSKHRSQLHMEMDTRTFCSGVMLVNLDYWRKNNSEKYLIEYAKRKREEVWLHDQDVLNYLFKNKWFFLPPKWNKLAYSLLPEAHYAIKRFDIFEYIYSPIILHYADATYKPWYDIIVPNKKYYINYLKLSKYSPICFEKTDYGMKIKALKMSIKYYIKLIIIKMTNIQ